MRVLICQKSGSYSTWNSLLCSVALLIDAKKEVKIDLDKSSQTIFFHKNPWYLHYCCSIKTIDKVNRIVEL